MTSLHAGTQTAQLAGMEQQLSSTLKQMSGQVARLENLDQEQRAEVYAILRAIQMDTEAHQAAAGLLAKKQA